MICRLLTCIYFVIFIYLFVAVAANKDVYIMRNSDGRAIGYANSDLRQLRRIVKRLNLEVHSVPNYTLDKKIQLTRWSGDADIRDSGYRRHRSNRSSLGPFVVPQSYKLLPQETQSPTPPRSDDAAFRNNPYISTRIAIRVVPKS